MASKVKGEEDLWTPIVSVLHLLDELGGPEQDIVDEVERIGRVFPGDDEVPIG
jgi:hypothetical protein